MTRVPYEKLTDDEREALHEWCRVHNIVPANTPIDPVIEYDPATDEWRIEQYVKSASGSILIRDEAGMTRFLRRVRTADLVWRQT